MGQGKRNRMRGIQNMTIEERRQQAALIDSMAVKEMLRKVACFKQAYGAEYETMVRPCVEIIREEIKIQHARGVEVTPLAVGAKILKRLDKKRHGPVYQAFQCAIVDLGIEHDPICQMGGLKA